MGGFHEILILLSFFLEVFVLSYLELKAWKTLYTPLIFLMWPYVIILILSIAISGNHGFVVFYYPSILIWSVGLAIFAIPSYALAYIAQKHNIPISSHVKEEQMPKILVLFAIVIIALFALRFKSISGGISMIGSDEFGEQFCGRGFWGHLRQLSLPILMMAIYFVDKKNKWLWLIIIPILAVTILYQVKGWVIIPCLTGLVLRLYAGKTKLRLSLLIYVVLGAMMVFLASYILGLVVADGNELGSEVLSFIFRNFVHYLTSGTLGLSVDMQMGFPDKGDFEMVIAQVVNLGNVLVGNDELIIPLNQLYYNTGVNYTNVRTLFGTIFINSGYVTFGVFVLFLSSMMYLMKLATIRFNSIYMYVAYFFECGLLFMGWFDSYFANLSALEIPVLALLLLVIDRACEKKQEEAVCLG